MKRVFKAAAVSVVAGLSLSISASAFAGGYLGKIGRVTVQQPNYVFISLGGHNSAPGCQGGSDEFAIDISTTLGKSQYAFVLTAKALESDVQVIGTGTCSLWPDRESVNYLFSAD